MLIRVHDGEIAGVQPATGIDSAGGCLWLLVIAFHDLVTARTQFSLLTYRQSFAGSGGNDFHFGIDEGRPMVPMHCSTESSGWAIVITGDAAVWK